MESIRDPCIDAPTVPVTSPAATESPHDFLTLPKQFQGLWPLRSLAAGTQGTAVGLAITPWTSEALQDVGQGLTHLKLVLMVVVIHFFHDSTESMKRGAHLANVSRSFDESHVIFVASSFGSEDPALESTERPCRRQSGPQRTSACWPGPASGESGWSQQKLCHGVSAVPMDHFPVQ